MKKKREALNDKADTADSTGDIVLVSDIVEFDRKKTVEIVEEDLPRMTVEEEEESKVAQRSPPGKVRAALRKFIYTGRQEETYEQWKEKKLSKKTGEKRKAEVEEDPGTEEKVTGTPNKVRKVVVPGKIQILKTKFNYPNTSPKIPGRGGGGQVRLARAEPGGVGVEVGKGGQVPLSRKEPVGAGGQVQLAIAEPGGVEDEVGKGGQVHSARKEPDGVSGEVLGGGGQVKLAKKERGGVGGAVGVCGAINSPIITQQRGMEGKYYILTDASIAAAEMGEKTGFGETADSTVVQ